MKRYFASRALLPEGWRHDVRIDVDAAGDIVAVQPDCSDPAAREDADERFAGPLLPGMANLHSHAFQRAMAGLAETRGPGDDDFWSWRECMYRFVARLTPDDAFAIARFLYVEMLRNGYTAVAEFHYVHNRPDGAPYPERAEMLLRHLAAARDAGIAITLLPSLYRWSNFGSRPLAPRQCRFDTDPAAVLRMVEAARRAAGTDPDVRIGVAPHSLRAADLASIEELLAGIDSIDATAPVHVHAAEQTKEVDDSVAATGQRPVQWLLAHLPVDRRWCLVHATHMTDRETTALAHSGAVAGLCPTTEANLGDGLFPILDFRAAGGAYGIGGDSHVSRDPAEELRWLEYGQRLSLRRRNLIVGGGADPAQGTAVGSTLWAEAAVGGGRAMGRPMGAIAPGLRADLVELDADAPDLCGRSGDTVANALVFSGSTGLVRNVMVGGRWVVRDRRHRLDADVDRDYRRVVARLLADD